MAEMVEFFEFYEMYKAMKNSKSTESVASTQTATATTNNVESFYNNNSIVQRGNDVVNFGKPNNNTKDVPTVYTVEKIDGISGFFRIKNGINTYGKKYIDENGKEKQHRFNRIAYKLANDAIKELRNNPEYGKYFIEREIPIEGKKRGWLAWGFKTEKMCKKVIEEILPKVIAAADIDKMKDAK